MNNNSLFDYITSTVDAAKETVDFAILFKIQNPDDITEEFEKYLIKIGKNKDWRRGGTNLLYEANGKNVLFTKTKSDTSTPFPANTNDVGLPINWKMWDVTIILN